MKITSENFKESKYYKKFVNLWGRKEYPLWSSDTGCPVSRYVGGTSKHLCECRYPFKCPGVLKVANEYEEEQNGNSK